MSRRNKPRTISPLKFSSLTRRSMHHFLLGPMSHQASPKFSPVGLLGLDGSPNRLRFFGPLAQVVLRLVPEIPREHRVYVGELESVVALDNALGGRAIFKGVNDSLQHNTRAG